MEISVEIVKILPMQSFVSSKTGEEMHRHLFVGKTLRTQYPKNICFQVFGDDKFSDMRVVVGRSYSVSFDIESRMVNTSKGEQWFTSVNAWRAVCLDSESANTQQQFANNQRQEADRYVDYQKRDSGSQIDDAPF